MNYKRISLIKKIIILSFIVIGIIGVNYRNFDTYSQFTAETKGSFGINVVGSKDVIKNVEIVTDANGNATAIRIIPVNISSNVELKFEEIKIDVIDINKDKDIDNIKNYFTLIFNDNKPVFLTENPTIIPIKIKDKVGNTIKPIFTGNNYESSSGVSVSFSIKSFNGFVSLLVEKVNFYKEYIKDNIT